MPDSIRARSVQIAGSLGVDASGALRRSGPVGQMMIKQKNIPALQ